MNFEQNYLGLGSKSVKVTRFVNLGFLGPKFPISDDKDASLPPHAGMVPFIWEIYFLFSGDKVCVGGRSYCCSCTIS